MPKTESPQDRFKRLQEKMAKHKTGGADYWKPEEGKSVIRILPPVKKMEFFFQEVGKHQLSDESDIKTLVCPAFTTDGEMHCPICEASKAAYDSGYKELGGKLKVRRYFHMQILVRVNGEFEGPK